MKGFVLFARGFCFFFTLCMWLSSDQMVLLTMLTFFYQIDLGAGRKFLLPAPQTDMVSTRKCKVFLPSFISNTTQPPTPTHFFSPYMRPLMHIMKIQSSSFAP